MLKLMPATVNEDQLEFHGSPISPELRNPVILLELELICRLAEPCAPLIELVSRSCEMSRWHSVLAEYRPGGFFDLDQDQVPCFAGGGEPEEIRLSGVKARKQGLRNEKMSEWPLTRRAGRPSRAR